MIREPGKNKNQCGFVMESAKEAQDWDNFLPPTADIPETHEQFVENVRDGERLIKVVTLREKVGFTPPGDGLDSLDLEALELEAVKKGMDVGEWRKLNSRAKKIKAIREAKQPAGV